MRTLEQEFAAMLETDPRYLESPGVARARGIFLLGAQAVLESIKSQCPNAGVSRDELIAAMERVNEEIGQWLGVVSRTGGSASTH